MRNLIRCSVLATLAVATQAQARTDVQGWQTLNIGVALSDTVKITNELVARESRNRGFYELENATMVNVKVTPKVTLAAGYVHNPSYSFDRFTAMEHRAREQVTVDRLATLGPLTLSARLRLEQRWRDNITGMGWRLRPYVKASAKFVGKSTLNLSHEDFIDLNTTTFQRVDGYERSRSAVSVAMPLNKRFGLEIGYLHQLGVVPGGADNVDHVGTVAISANF